MTKNKKIISIITFSILAILIFVGYSTRNSNLFTKEKLLIGLYTEKTNENSLENIDIKHYFSVWGKEFNTKNDEYIKVFNQAHKEHYEKYGREKKALLTVEPWPQFGEESDRSLLLNNIANGKYNDIIKDLCSSIQQKSEIKVIIRWGHEMELFKTSRYPWAFSDSKLFIKAYQKWVDTCNSHTSKVKYMWSPAGNEGFDSYYPTDKYVDYVGLSWYSYPAFEWYTYQKIYTFEEIMSDKYNRLKKFNKPVYAAEFGIAGLDDHKKKMYEILKDREKIKDKYPLLEAIVLFSDETESWVEGKIEAPNWIVPEEILKNL
jgi:beta-mannanase